MSDPISKKLSWQSSPRGSLAQMIEYRTRLSCADVGADQKIELPAFVRVPALSWKRPMIAAIGQAHALDRLSLDVQV